MAGGTFDQRRASDFLVLVTIVSGFFGHWRLRHSEQLPATGEFLFSVAIAEEAVIANALEALGQDVEQEATDELVGSEGHRLLSVAVAIVPPAETDHAVFNADVAAERRCPATHNRSHDAA